MNKVIWILFLLVFSNSVFAQKKGGDPNSVHIPQKGTQSELESRFTKATGYFLADKFDKALLSFEKLAKEDKENASVFFMISRCYLAKNELKATIKHGKKAISFHDSEREFFLYYAKLLQEHKSTKEATETLEQLFNKEKEQSEDYHTLGESYRKLAIEAKEQTKVIKLNNGSQKQLKEVENQFYNNLEKEYLLYKKYSEKYTITPEIHDKKLNTLFILNRYEEAWNEGMTFIKQNPDDLSIVYNHCSTFFKKFPEKSISLLEETTTKHPDYIQNQLLLHDFYNQTNQPEKATNTILAVFNNKNFSLDKKLKTTQSYLHTHTALHQETAKKMMETIKTQYPKSGIVYSLEGDYYLSHLSIDSARLSYLKAVEHSPNTGEIWDKIFRISLQNKKYSLLLQDAKKAIKSNSDSPILYYYKGFAHYQQQQYDSTVQALETAKKSQPTGDLDLQINHLLAETYYKNNQLEKAWNTYELILEATPNDPHTLNNYSYFLALSDTRLSQAESMSKTLMRLKPNEATYIDTYAWVLFKNKKYAKALKAIEPIALKSTSAEVIEHYGDILAKNNRITEAITQWKKALTLDPNNKSLSKKITQSENK